MGLPHLVENFVKLSVLYTIVCLLFSFSPLLYDAYLIRTFVKFGGRHYMHISFVHFSSFGDGIMRI